MQPVQKVSKARKRKRRSHHAIVAVAYTRCHQCGSAKKPHSACANCGYHNPNVSVSVAGAADAAE